MNSLQMARRAGAALLVLAIAPMPYAFYQLIRFIVTSIAAVGLYQSFRDGHKAWGWTWASISIVFNPVAPIYLGKEIWRFVDLIVALVLVISSLRHLRPPKGADE